MAQRGARPSSASSLCGALAFLAAAALCCAATPASAGGTRSAQETATADVLIQAGHEGRPDCLIEPAKLCNNTGAAAAPGEIAWTPIVADEATRILRAAGLSVLREKAHLHGIYHVRAALFIHFDGGTPPCSTRASVGYPKDRASEELAHAWKALYARFWPYGFMPDNFTSSLATYFGYTRVHATDGRLLVEGGDMACRAQHAWLAKHLRFEGALLAHLISERFGKGNVALPPDLGPH